MALSVGIAIAARTPRIVATTKNSMRAKPCLCMKKLYHIKFATFSVAKFKIRLFDTAKSPAVQKEYWISDMAEAWLAGMTVGRS